MGEAEAIAAAPASPRKPSGMFSYLLLIVFLVVVVYPLSVGPVVWLYSRYPNTPGERQISNLYRPLGMLCRHSRLASEWAESYMRLWHAD